MRRKEVVAPRGEPRNRGRTCLARRAWRTSARSMPYKRARLRNRIDEYVNFCEDYRRRESGGGQRNTIFGLAAVINPDLKADTIGQVMVKERRVEPNLEAIDAPKPEVDFREAQFSACPHRESRCCYPTHVLSCDWSGTRTVEINESQSGTCRQRTIGFGTILYFSKCDARNTNALVSTLRMGRLP